MLWGRRSREDAKTRFARGDPSTCEGPALEIKKLY
jgi:hypothetical protein